jgi:choline dehydrogenase-like flavoprotein
MTRVVVVGGGVAGLTFAHVLRRESRGNVDIVVLESGERRVGTAQLPMDDPHFTHADSLVVRTAERGPEWYPRGRGVGGGALINGRLAMAGAPSFWDAWSTDHGAVGWSWERIEPHVAAVPVVEVLSPEMNRWANAGRAIGWTVLPTQVFGQPIDDMIGDAVVEQAHVDALVMDAGHVVGVRSSCGVGCRRAGVPGTCAVQRIVGQHISPWAQGSSSGELYRARYRWYPCRYRCRV